MGGAERRWAGAELWLADDWVWGVAWSSIGRGELWWAGTTGVGGTWWVGEAPDFRNRDTPHH